MIKKERKLSQYWGFQFILSILVIAGCTAFIKWTQPADDIRCVCLVVTIIYVLMTLAELKADSKGDA